MSTPHTHRRPRRPWRPWSSARLQLTLSITVTVALVFAAVIGIAFQLLWFDTERNANDRISEETSEFVTFAREGSLPSTGQASPTVTALLRSFLSTRYPDDAIIYIATSADGETQITLARYPQENAVTFSPESRDRLQAIGMNPDSGSSGHLERGGVRWGKVVIDNEAGEASLTVAVDAAPAHANDFDVIELLIAASAIGLVFAALIAWMVAGRTLHPVKRIREVADQISADDLSRRVPEDGADELAALSRTVNAMLERVETAYQTQREFLDDAGHELRTPLTVVQGNLDLLSDDPEERTETMRIVQDELTRMSRIVEDLLTLARSNRPDFLRTEVVNAADLVLDLESKVEVTADRRWLIRPEFDGQAVIDPHRITQALLQFCANAVRFTTPDSLIEIGVRRLERGSAEPGASPVRTKLLWWVRDSGAGIPEGQEELIFDRFQTARGQLRDGRGGTGLGLAIVASIATAHGGRAVAFNNDDRGATFAITIPLVEPPGGSGSGNTEPDDDDDCGSGGTSPGSTGSDADDPDEGTGVVIPDR